MEFYARSVREKIGVDDTTQGGQTQLIQTLGARNQLLRRFLQVSIATFRLRSHNKLDFGNAGTRQGFATADKNSLRSFRPRQTDRKGNQNHRSCIVSDGYIALFVIMRYATLTPNPLSQRERGFEAVLFFMKTAISVIAKRAAYYLWVRRNRRLVLRNSPGFIR